MFLKIKDYLRDKLKNYLGLSEINNQIDQLKFLNGKILIENIIDTTNLNDCDTGVYSQAEEDSVIQLLISKINIKNKTFFELGCSNYVESNTRYLALNDKWQGLIVDGSLKNINDIKKSYYYWKLPLNAKQYFITKENIIKILSQYSKEKKFGLLSIDLDGNDYWILKEIISSNYSFDIIICEYNSLLGSLDALTIPYQANFIREQNENIKNYGASIQAFKKLLSKDYKLIYGNKLGNNIFFLKKEHHEFSEKSIEECFKENLFDEYSIKRNYKLTYNQQVKKINLQNFEKI